MKELINRRIKAMILISLSLLFLGSKTEMLAEGEYIIVRIVDVDYPPEVDIEAEYNLTFFAFILYYEIENPTQTPIYMDYLCSPFPFPWLETSLENDSITARIGMGIEWVSGNYEYPPGVYEGSYEFNIELEPYVNSRLPKGDYTLWLNFTDCCSVYVPVVVEKIHIVSTEEGLQFIFESGDVTETHNYPTPTNTEESSIGILFLIQSILLIVISNKVKFMKKRK